MREDRGSVRPAPKLDWGDLNRPEISAFFERARTLLRQESGAYLTLSRLGEQRMERQVGRLPRVWSRPLESWVGELLTGMRAAGRVRFRLRLWGTRGRPEGGVMFWVGYPEQSMAASVQADGQGSLEAGVAARLSALEGAVARLEGRVRTLAGRSDAGALQDVRAELATLREHGAGVSRVSALETGLESLAELVCSLERKQNMIFEVFVELGK